MRPRSSHAVQRFTCVFLHVDAGDKCTWRTMVIKIMGKTQRPPIWAPCWNQDGRGSSGISHEYLWSGISQLIFVTKLGQDNRYTSIREIPEPRLCNFFPACGSNWTRKLGVFGRLRQLGCPIAQGNHFLVQATMIYIVFARPGKYKSEVSLLCTNLINQVRPTNIKNHILIRYKTSAYNDFLTLHILFSYSGTFGQAVLWPSLPDWAIKKRENCRSLVFGFSCRSNQNNRGSSDCVLCHLHQLWSECEDKQKMPKIGLGLWGYICLDSTFTSV